MKELALAGISFEKALISVKKTHKFRVLTQNFRRNFARKFVRREQKAEILQKFGLCGLFIAPVIGPGSLISTPAVAVVDKH